MNYILKYKYILLLLVSLVAVLSLAIYYKPMRLSDTLDAYTDIKFIYMELGTRDGNANIDDSGFITLSVEECEQLYGIFNQYTYTKNIEAVFSDGSMGGLGSKVVYIYTYQNDVLINTILLSSSDKVSYNNKIYSLSNSDELVNEITEMMNEWNGKFGSSVFGYS